MRSSSDNYLGKHSSQLWLLGFLLLRSRWTSQFGFPDPFSSCIPIEIAAVPQLESLPNDLLDRLQAVIEATVLIQQPWDEGRSVRLIVKV